MVLLGNDDTSLCERRLCHEHNLLYINCIKMSSYKPQEVLN